MKLGKKIQKIMSFTGLARLFTYFPIVICIFQKTRKDVSNFDREFTSEAPKMTPTDKLFIMNLDQTEFTGFSFVNPEYIISV